RRRAVEPRGEAQIEGEAVTLLRTVNLHKQFGETRACDGLDFVVNQGEFLSLVGSNAAGKTTLVNLSSAHLQPDSEQILFHDHDTPRTPITGGITIGIARSFQSVILCDGLSVFDNVALSIFSRDRKTAKIAALAEHDRAVRDEAYEVLGQFGLNGKAAVPAGGLAPGERKVVRGAIAHALRPKLFVLGEPNSGGGTHGKAQVIGNGSSVVWARS